MQQLFDLALREYREGNCRAAAEACRRLLAADEKHPEAWHLLGVIRLQEGLVHEAIEYIGRAVALRPNAADFLVDLAEAYRADGKSPQAVECCRAALRLQANHPGGWNTQGLTLLDLGNPAEAADAFRRAIESQPEDAPILNNLGVALLALGQQNQALEQFRRAIELDPDFAPGRANLGRLLLERGQAKAALPHNEAAVRLLPNAADPIIDLSNILHALGRTDEAQLGYREAIRLAPHHAVPYANLGRLLRDQALLGEGTVCLKSATEHDTENAAYWNELADLYWETDAASAAISAWQRALALDPKRAFALSSLGWALQEEGRLSEANDCYQAALRLQPDLAPAHLNIGVLHEEKGNLAEAESSYREAIRLQPTFALAHSRLATLLRGKLPDADLAAIEACLVNPHLHDDPYSRLFFGLAHVLDAKGDYPRAADCLRKANALSLKMNQLKLRGYDPAEHERFVDRLIAGFSREWFVSTVGAGLPSRRPVFVFGLPRSGTTLVEQILASHPAMHGAGELALARRGFESLPTVLGRSDAPIQCLASLDSATIRRKAKQHLDQLAHLAPKRAERVVDKMPENYLYLGWLVGLFPNAVFIHCRRDLRDIALSSWMTDFRTLRWTNSPEHIAARIGAYRRLMAHWEATCPVAIHPVHYEETVSDLESVARRIIAACGLEWNPACLEFHRSTRTVRTASVTQVRQPIYKSSVSRWKKYEHDLADLFAALPQDEFQNEAAS